MINRFIKGRYYILKGDRGMAYTHYNLCLKEQYLCVAEPEVLLIHKTRDDTPRGWESGEYGEDNGKYKYLYLSRYNFIEVERKNLIGGKLL